MGWHKWGTAWGYDSCMERAQYGENLSPYADELCNENLV